jgi:hypothetical protein
MSVTAALAVLALIPWVPKKQVEKCICFTGQGTKARIAIVTVIDV